MTNEAESLGVCPECGAAIHKGQILIEYTTEEGDTECFADCYSCEAVVRPE